MNFQQFQAHNQREKLKRVENIKEGKESKEWIETKNACDLSSRTHGLFSGCSLASLLHLLESKQHLLSRFMMTLVQIRNAISIMNNRKQ